MGMQWNAWGTTVRVEVTDPDALPSAHRLVARCLADAERAADLGRRSAQVHQLTRSAGQPVAVRPTLSALVAVALDVAERSAGAVDPTVGVSTLALYRARHAIGLSALPACSALPTLRPRPAPGWRSVHWSERYVTVPATTALDLTAAGKARTARLAASVVADRLGVGVVVEVGGDVATAGPQPRAGWRVHPAHLGGQAVDLEPGTALAACRVDGVVDPLTGRQVVGPWAAIGVIADDVITAKTAVVAALVHGADAEAYLERWGLPALFVPFEHRQPAGSAA
jgi:thiamine biosynthesis lipoprotein